MYRYAASSEKYDHEQKEDACTTKDMSGHGSTLNDSIPGPYPSHEPPLNSNGYSTATGRSPLHDGSHAFSLPPVPFMHLAEPIMIPLRTLPPHHQHEHHQKQQHQHQRQQQYQQQYQHQQYQQYQQYQHQQHQQHQLQVQHQQHQLQEHQQQSYASSSLQSSSNPNQQFHYSNHSSFPQNQQYFMDNRNYVYEVPTSPSNRRRMNEPSYHSQPPAQLQLAPYPYPRQQIRSVQTEPQKQNVPNPSVVCNCVKSRCLKLYCDCYKAEELCNVFCKCVSCRNVYSESLPGGLLFRMKSEYKLHKPESFGKKTKKTGEGCSCKNNRCLKKYCDCFRNGTACSEKCLCLDCANIAANKPATP